MSTYTSNFLNVSCQPYSHGLQPQPAIAHILIVDVDPAGMLEQLGPRFCDSYRIQTAATAAAALQSILADRPNIIFLDPKLPDQPGLELQKQIHQRHPQIPVIFACADHTADIAIKAIQQGAFDFVYKPVDHQQLQRVVSAALQSAPLSGSPPRSSVAVASSPWEDEVDGALTGSCSMMREVYKSIGLVAAQNVNVLITGESGTGKELVARAIVRHSARSEAPFLALNCAAIPENLLESELFGHEKGAFSGADRRRIGKFEQYNGGTILLDEIGDMPLHLQAKVLRLLQEQSFERVGGNETIRTNVRLIASTHRDLKSWTAQGRFRADLYYRLSVFTVHLPPLRERDGDLPALVRHYVQRYGREMGRHIRDIAQDTMERLQQYHWPGNIRELQSVIRQALLRSNGEVLLPSALPAFSEASLQIPQEKPTSSRDFDVDDFLRQRLGPDTNNLYADLHRELDRHTLARVMTYTRGNRRMASRVLGIARQTLRLKLRESGLQSEQSAESEEELSISDA
jgi:DNA-binding NtrC family response regulator